VSIASSSDAFDAKEDTFAGGFASGASEEMCFSPPPGAAVRVPDASRVLFRGETRSRYDDVSDSEMGSLPLDGLLGTALRSGARVGSVATVRIPRSRRPSL
jgi:hypothetical protein